MNVAVIKALGWAGADKDNIEELVEQSEDVIANSFGVEADFSGEIPSTPRHTHALLKLLKQLCCPPPQPPPPTAWFDKSVPAQSMSPVDKQGLKLFLIGVAKKNMIAKKMARYGVGLKIAMDTRVRLNGHPGGPVRRQELL